MSSFVKLTEIEKHAVDTELYIHIYINIYIKDNPVPSLLSINTTRNSKTENTDVEKQQLFPKDATNAWKRKKTFDQSRRPEDKYLKTKKRLRIIQQ